MMDRFFKIWVKMLALAGLVCLPLGCGSREPPLVPVSGTVMVEGKALDLGWITFYPDESKGNTSAALPLAEIRKDGSYTMTTNGKPGARPGHYKVVVAATHDPLLVRPPPPVDGKPWQPHWLHHEKYAKPETTDLRIEVVETPAPDTYHLLLAP